MRVGSKNVFASKKTMRSRSDLKKQLLGGEDYRIFFCLVVREEREEAMATLEGDR
jgi:hypothetical protein